MSELDLVLCVTVGFNALRVPWFQFVVFFKTSPRNVLFNDELFATHWKYLLCK